jgi:hypothetical protein
VEQKQNHENWKNILDTYVENTEVKIVSTAKAVFRKDFDYKGLH